jgi:hypothetical protein
VGEQGARSATRGNAARPLAAGREPAALAIKRNELHEVPHQRCTALLLHGATVGRDHRHRSKALPRSQSQEQRWVRRFGVERYEVNPSKPGFVRFESEDVEGRRARRFSRRFKATASKAVAALSGTESKNIIIVTSSHARVFCITSSASDSGFRQIPAASPGMPSSPQAALCMFLLRSIGRQFTWMGCC